MRPGCGAYPLRGHNNVQGASDMGAMPNSYPGYQSVTDPAIREKFEKGWGVALSPERGLDNHQMVDAIHEGKLRAMYLAGEDMISRRLECKLCRSRLREAGSVCGAGYLFLRNLPLC